MTLNLAKDGTRQFNGLIDVYKKTLASDGIGGLYRGFVISAVGIFIYRGKKRPVNSTESHGAYERFI